MMKQLFVINVKWNGTLAVIESSNRVLKIFSKFTVCIQQEYLKHRKN